MTNLIPVWKEPTPRAPRPCPDCHRSRPINIAAVTQTRLDREGHAIVPLTCSFSRPILDRGGQRIPLCILSHSAAVGAAPPAPPPPPQPHQPASATDPRVMADHLLKGISSCKITLSSRGSRGKKGNLNIFWGVDRLKVGGWWVKHRVVMGDKGESRVSCIVLNVVTVKRWVEGLWRPFSTQQAHACTPRQREWSPDTSPYARFVTDITKTGKSLTRDKKKKK